MPHSWLCVTKMDERERERGKKEQINTSRGKYFLSFERRLMDIDCEDEASE